MGPGLQAGSSGVTRWPWAVARRVGPPQRSLAGGVNTVSSRRGAGGPGRVCSLPTQSFRGSTLVSAVRGLLSFLSFSLPHLSQSESLRGPNVTWAFLIRLRGGKQGHPLGGQSSQPRTGSFRLEESPLAAEVRVCLPCVCNSLIFEDTFLAASSEPWHRAGPGRVPAEADQRGALPRAPQSASPFLCL